VSDRVLLFDGVCHLCNDSVVWVIDRDPQGLLRFASLQSPAGSALARQHGIDPEALEGLVLVDGERAWQGSAAALRAGRLLRFPWWFLAWLGWLVPWFLRDLVYGWIARNRYRWFGKSEVCRIPTPELRERLLDAESH
jgi:predicted DCC family thiol-disulfide oxidoreductase YuxK